MRDERLVALVVRELREYAQKSVNEVGRGLETPRLSATLLNKYGSGLAKATAIIFDNNRIADPIWIALDEELARLDPDWEANRKRRWAARPADLA